jgi:5-methylthioadenosine/S-adenosylhomocysteine deaminase
LKLLIENVSIVPMTKDNYHIEKGYIVIVGNLIEEIGVGEAPAGHYDQRLNGHDQMALPGFTNAHTHAAMTFLRGYADDLPLMEWLENKIWPLEAKLTGEDVYWGTMLAIVEMLKSGTTCFADMYFFMDEVARAVEKSGMRAVLARGMVGLGPENEKAITDSRELVGKWNGKANGRIKFILGPHAPYTCPPDYLRRVMELAEELKVGVHIHVAETAGEFADINHIYGKTPVAHLESLGLFEHQVLAAHCVHLSEQDIEILVKHRVGVVHNPESNMKLASGIAPVPEMLKAGIPVALGTDGASSNNNLDMLQEMRTCALLHKVNSLDPTVIPAYQALQMATVNGPKALGLDAEIGQIKAGMKADIILISTDKAHFIPCYDIVANLVYSGQASDVNTVIIDGNIIMQDRVIKTIDEKEVLAQAKRLTSKFRG